MLVLILVVSLTLNAHAAVVLLSYWTGEHLLHHVSDKWRIVYLMAELDTFNYIAWWQEKGPESECRRRTLLDQ